MMMYHEYNIISIIIIMMYHIICIHIHILLHYFIISLIICTHHFCLIVPYRNVVGHALRFLSNYSPKSSFDHLIAAGYRFLVNHVTGNRRVHLFDRSSTVLRYSILYAAPNLRQRVWYVRKELYALYSRLPDSFVATIVTSTRVCASLLHYSWILNHRVSLGRKLQPGP